MSDPDLKQLLADKNMDVPPQEPGVSTAMALLMAQGYTLGEDSKLQLPDESTYELKPLSEVYAEAKSPAGEMETQALCMAAEFAIAFYDHENSHGLNDSDTIRMLEKLSMKPETALTGVGALVQAHLRMELSLADYSRADVRTAVRRILRSAQRHSKGDPRGYLNFIHHFAHPHHH